MSVPQIYTIVIQMQTALTLKDHLTVLASMDTKETVPIAMVSVNCISLFKA